MSQPPSVARSARTVSFAVLGSRLLGLVREQVLASIFGASREFDAFVTAFRIPNLLRDLFAEGALSAAFVTTFSQKLTSEGEESAWRLANLVLNALLVVLGVITVIGIIFAPVVVNLIAPGFQQIPGKTELTVRLTRIMFPFLLLVAMAALAMGMLNSKHKFGVPASASMMFNIGSIVGGVGLAFALAPNFLHDTTQLPRAMVGISIGTLIGGAMQWLVQVPSLRAVGYHYQPLLDWHDPAFRQVVRLVGPSVLGVAAVQINVFTDNWFASFFGNGAVTFLNCAFRLMQFPIGLFGVAIGVATLPTVSAHIARGNTGEFRKTLARSIRLAFFLCIPAACGLAVLAKPVVAVVYQHGRFSAEATAQTAFCLQAFAVGLAGYAAIKVIAPTFYALGDSRTPMYISIASIVTNAGLDYVFAMPAKFTIAGVPFPMNMGTPGVALSTSVVALVNFFLLLVFMRRKIQRIEAGALWRSLLRIGLASLAMSAAAWGAAHALEGHRYAAVAAAVTAALLVFGAFCKLLRVEELGELIAVLKFGAKQEPLA